MLLLVTLMLGAGCASDDDESGSFGSLQRSAELGALDADQAMALCDATIDLRDTSTAEGDARRGGCVAEVFSEVRVALLNVENDPDNYSLDAVTEACEAALDRCMDEGPTVLPCESLTFESSCHATVGDYERCIAGAVDVTAKVASADCETFVNSEDERARVTEVLQDSLDSCTDELRACDGQLEPPPDVNRTWLEGDLSEVGKVETDASVPDTSSNEVWLDQLESLVEGYERADCDAALVRDAEVDAAAARVAAVALGAEVDLALDVLAEWHTVVAGDIETVIPRMSTFLDENSAVCTWVRYGIAVDGEPGESRKAVLLLAE